METQVLTTEQKQLVDFDKSMFTYDEYEEIFTVNTQDEIVAITHTETTRTGEPTVQLRVSIKDKENGESEFTIELENFKTKEYATCGNFKSHIGVCRFLQILDLQFCEKNLGYLGNKRIDIILDEMDFDDLYNKFVDCFKVNRLCMEIIEKFVLDTDYLDDFREFIIENFKGEFSTEQLYDVFHKQVIEMNL